MDHYYFIITDHYYIIIMEHYYMIITDHYYIIIISIIITLSLLHYQYHYHYYIIIMDHYYIIIMDHYYIIITDHYYIIIISIIITLSLLHYQYHYHYYIIIINGTSGTINNNNVIMIPEYSIPLFSSGQTWSNIPSCVFPLYLRTHICQLRIAINIYLLGFIPQWEDQLRSRLRLSDPWSLCN